MNAKRMIRTKYTKFCQIIIKTRNNYNTRVWHHRKQLIIGLVTTRAEHKIKHKPYLSPSHSPELFQPQKFFSYYFMVSITFGRMW